MAIAGATVGLFIFWSKNMETKRWIQGALNSTHIHASIKIRSNSLSAILPVDVKPLDSVLQMSCGYIDAVQLV